MAKVFKRKSYCEAPQKEISLRSFIKENLIMAFHKRKSYCEAPQDSLIVEIFLLWSSTRSSQARSSQARSSNARSSQARSSQGGSLQGGSSQGVSKYNFLSLGFTIRLPLMELRNKISFYGPSQ